MSMQPRHLSASVRRGRPRRESVKKTCVLVLYIGAAMVACSEPLRVWIESGVIATKGILAHIEPSSLYPCDAHRAERIKENKKDGLRGFIFGVHGERR